MAKVAVITRTKNRPLLLGRALESAQNQTFKDFIQVVVNDGGDSNEVDELVKKYNSSHIKIIHNSQSLGLTKALNKGVKSVESEYIAILDDDDTWSNDRLAVVVDYMDKTRSKATVSVTDRIVEKLVQNKIVIESQNRWHEGVESVSLYKQCLDNYMSNGAVVYKRELYDELGGYDESLEVAEDWDFGIRTLLRYDVEFIKTKHPLCFYHHRPKQKGDEGNSVFASIDQHHYSINKLCNKYIREDIANGVMGIGYIMNNLRYERERDAICEQKDNERVVRIEGHINHSTERMIRKLYQLNENTIKRTLNKVLFRLKKRG